MLKVNYKFFIIAMIALVSAIMFGGNLPYAVLYSFIIAIIVSFIYIYIIKQSIYIGVDVESKIYTRGDSSLITINVGNEGNLPNCYTIIKSDTIATFDDKYNGDIVSLKGDDYILIKNRIIFRKRGIYDFGDISWGIKDMFFIFKYSSNINMDVKIKVYPKVNEINSDFIIKNYVSQNTLNNRSVYEDPYTMSDVRKYNYGDSLKKIHWKISAKYNELYVKNVDSIIGQHCDLFMDMSENGYATEGNHEDEEKSVDFCVSFINYLISKGLKTTLYINNLSSRQYEIGNSGDFINVMDYFLENKSTGKRLFSNYIKSNLLRLHNSDWVGIICINFNEGIIDELVCLKEYGCDVNLFYEITETIQNNKIEKLKNLGIKCININKLIN